MANPKKISDYVPILADQGMDYLAAAVKAGVTIQTKKITQPGAAPLVVDLVAEGLTAMADTDYVVLVQGETVARVTVDESSVTTAGFDVLGGAITEVVHLVVIGRVAGQVA